MKTLRNIAGAIVLCMVFFGGVRDVFSCVVDVQCDAYMYCTSTDPDVEGTCANLNCTSCQTVQNHRCVNKTDGTSCGSNNGCSRCVSGVCLDYANGTSCGGCDQCNDGSCQTSCLSCEYCQYDDGYYCISNCSYPQICYVTGCGPIPTTAPTNTPVPTRTPTPASCASDSDCSYAKTKIDYQVCSGGRCINACDSNGNCLLEVARCDYGHWRGTKPDHCNPDAGCTDGKIALVYDKYYVNGDFFGSCGGSHCDWTSQCLESGQTCAVGVEGCITTTPKPNYPIDCSYSDNGCPACSGMIGLIQCLTPGAGYSNCGTVCSQSAGGWDCNTLVEGCPGYGAPTPTPDPNITPTPTIPPCQITPSPQDSCGTSVPVLSAGLGDNIAFGDQLAFYLSKKEADDFNIPGIRSATPVVWTMLITGDKCTVKGQVGQMTGG